MAEALLGPIRAPVDASGKSAAWLTEYLRQARVHRSDDAEAVAEYGSALLGAHASSLSQAELWTVHEQVAIAALRSGRHALALQLVREVHRRFRSSVRASRLAGLLAEAAGDDTSAATLYARELDAEPGNVLMTKRQMAGARAGGDATGAIALLRAHLARGGGDVAAWEELAELYLLGGAYAPAAFCLEEVLMLSPGNTDVLLLLADVLTTIGSATALRSARGYYALVLEFTGGRSARARYGALSVGAALATQGGRSGGRSTQEEDDGLAHAAGASLLREYAKRAPEKLPLVQALVKAQGA